MVNRMPARAPIEVKDGDLNAQHARNFLDWLTTRKKPNADIEEGHRTAVMANLGSISTLLGGTLKRDAAGGRIAGDTEANTRLDKAYHAPY